MTRMTRASLARAAPSNFASGTPAAMEMSKCSGAMPGRISSSNSGTWPGLTARIRHLAKLHDLQIGFRRSRAGFSVKSGAGRRRRIAGPDLRGLDQAGRNHPLASAPAICPLPENR